MPQVAWRAGIDVAPVDVMDPDACAWLETLVWPGQEDRTRLVKMVTDLSGHWISNEGQSVIDLPQPFTPSSRGDGRFLLAVDGVPRALTDPHGRSIIALPHI